MLLTKFVRDLVLGLEVEDVNWQNDGLEEVIILSMEVFLQRAVVVIEDNIWNITTISIH